jgi:adenylate cyclase
MRYIAQKLPKDPRCPICFFPFHGIGGKLMKTVTGREPSRLNPRLCNECEVFAKKYKGGAEIELSMLFADVRGSTGLAEVMNPTEFSGLIGRFYRAATGVLFRANAMVEKLKGDEVTGLFVPGFAGLKHARVAIQAARNILRVTGHEAKPWVPIGVGVHTGVARVGAVEGEGGVVEIAALGDSVNTASRLASTARQGEVVISESACAAAELEVAGLTQRELILKGRSEPVAVRVMCVGSAEQAG